MPQNKPERTVAGTSITESSMEKMLRHNRELVGGPADIPEVDHNRIAEGLLASQPVLLPGVGATAAPRIRATRMPIREGVQGTSPTPGQDNIDYIPPTTSNTADPGNIPAKGPDAENQPASKMPSKAEQLMKDLGTLFAEGENPFGKKGKKDKKDDVDDDDNDGGEEGEDVDGKDKKDKDDKDDKDGKDGKDKDDDGDSDEEPIEEAVQVNCESCGYEETYLLSESNIAEGNVPLTPDGKLDSKCPMCGADMDLSMIGATNVAEIGDPNPRTDARGNSGGPQEAREDAPTQKESVSPDAIRFASGLMQRIVAGESVETIAKVVIEGDFMERKKRAA